jgi:hypothetical protein
VWHTKTVFENEFPFLLLRYFGDLTVNPSHAPLTSTVPTTVPPNSSTFVPTFGNTQYSAPSPLAQQSTNPGSTDRVTPVVPPQFMPPFNFGMPNPQQQYFQPVPPSVFSDSQQKQQQQYFQPGPPPVFSDSQQQQQQQHPFQFNSTPNTFNAFSAPPPPSVQQTSRASPFANDHHGHSHDHEGSGHGHSHDHNGGHGHSHDH